MMHKIYIITALALLLNVKYSIAQQNPWQDSTYSVVWSDDFTGTSLDGNKWMRRAPWGFGWDTNMVMMADSTWTDLGWREPSMADTNVLNISAGTLKIKVKKQNVTGTCWSWPNCHNNTGTVICNSGPCSPTGNGDSTCWHTQNYNFKYVTAMLYSLYKFKYGYLEIKFKLPDLPQSPNTFNGIGPNFWLYGNDANNYWSEIDIFEMHGYTNVLTNTVHFRNSKNSTHYADGYTKSPALSGNTWHTAGAHWRPDGIDFYVDRQYVRSITDPNISPASLVEMPIFVDINVPTYGWSEVFDTTTVFPPYVFEIDYVKVWQLKEKCDTALSYCSNFNPATYNSQLYQSVTIGGTSCSDPVTNTPNLYIYGVDYILLNEGFSIDNNSGVFINVQPCSGTTFGQRTMSGNVISSPPSSWYDRRK